MSRIECTGWRLPFDTRRGLSFALLLGIAVLAGSCDGIFSLDGEHASRPAAGDSLQISLLTSGQVVTGLGEEGPLRMRTVPAPGSRKYGGVGAEKKELDSRHACTMTLYRPDGPRGAGYYARSAELAYPDSVLEKADGETKTLRSRIGGGAVPHASNTNALLRCRLPAVEGAEKRVRRFFRMGPEQLEGSGFERVDSTEAASWTKSRRGVRRKRGTCWFQRSCQRGPDGELQNCTEWEFDGCTGGGAEHGGGFEEGDLPSAQQPCTGEPCPFIYPDDMDGGPVDWAELSNPCESDNPPDYCDEAGSCFDQTISNENDRKIIRGLEANGELKELWEKSNASAADQSKREERGGWVVSNESGYEIVEFHEAESGINYTPIEIEGVTIGNRPSGTIASFHTHPFEPGEAIKDTVVIRQWMEEDEDYEISDYDLGRLAETGAVDYPSKPSDGDFISSEDLQGYLVDGERVYSYDGVNEIESFIDRCGY